MEECFDKEKAYRNYMDFCNRYKDFIENTIEKMNNLLEEIPKDATLYLYGDIEKALEHLHQIQSWIKNTLEMSIKDFWE